MALGVIVGYLVSPSSTLRRPLATLAGSLRACALRSPRFAGNVLGLLAQASSPNSLVGPMCVVVALDLLPRSRLRRSLARRSRAPPGATRQRIGGSLLALYHDDTLVMLSPENWGLILTNSRLRRSLSNSKSPQLFSRARAITH